MTLTYIQSYITNTYKYTLWLIQVHTNTHTKHMHIETTSYIQAHITNTVFINKDSYMHTHMYTPNICIHKQLLTCMCTFKHIPNACVHEHGHKHINTHQIHAQTHAYSNKRTHQTHTHTHMHTSQTQYHIHTTHKHNVPYTQTYNMIHTQTHNMIYPLYTNTQ